MPWCHHCNNEYAEGLDRCPDCGGGLSAQPPEVVQPGTSVQPGMSVPAWGFKGTDDMPQWPLDADGDPVPPAFLTRIMGFQIDYELTLSLLRAFGIPSVTQFPGNGEIVNVLFGFSGTGMDIYVPETMLDDARLLLSSEIDE